MTAIKQKSLRVLTWKDYGISKERRKELEGFCLQYRQKKKEAKRLGDYALAAVKTESIGGSSGISRPTETAALRHYSRSERAIKDCRMIEEAAMWAAEAGGYRKTWRAILRNVTDGVGFDNLVGLYEIPYSVADFYGIRRAFFYRLDRLQHGTAEGGDRAPNYQKQDEQHDDSDDTEGGETMLGARGPPP